MRSPTAKDFGSIATPFSYSIENVSLALCPIQNTATEQKIRKTLRCRKEEICSWTIKKRSVDARRKPELFFVYTIAVKTKNDSGMLHKCRNRNVTLFNKKDYSLPESGKEVLTSRPVVVGFGPAGLFCAYHLAEAGYRPIVLERGSSMEKRILDVEQFWNGEMLSERSNVQFGEGGAGTFSDGKLNTMVKDEKGRGKRILELFSMAGADKAICYENKPHIGTCLLYTSRCV